ncbi:unnamed protein product [Vitrella brassicaformis CCMP3155]|uniref:Conserved oligomeric Golgi complex subunit 1 n=3 Tax=Vitrella brassicaformis TaxID=1169539 RepID=A0A0G4EA57_VITBC|nr:unnamed protein product [Vitrella brassicaformis CCMP3155]|eukprot:CEL92467.1 unnamed protein product [Vitrella brassicaformis CCMP3155]
MRVASVDDLFRKQKLSTIRSILDKTDGEIKGKSEEIRQLVGARYRDVIESSDLLAKMHTHARTAQDSSAHILQLTKSLRELASESLGGRRADEEDPFQATAAHFETAKKLKYLLELSAAVWAKLRDHRFLEATSLILIEAPSLRRSIEESWAAHPPPPSLPASSPSPTDISVEQLVRQNRSQFQDLPQRLVADCVESLASVALTAVHAVDCLAAILLLTPSPSLSLSPTLPGSQPFAQHEATAGTQLLRQFMAKRSELLQALCTTDLSSWTAPRKAAGAAGAMDEGRPPLLPAIEEEGVEEEAEPPSIETALEEIADHVTATIYVFEATIVMAKCAFLPSASPPSYAIVRALERDIYTHQTSQAVTSGPPASPPSASLAFEMTHGDEALRFWTDLSRPTVLPSVDRLQGYLSDARVRGALATVASGFLSRWGGAVEQHLDGLLLQLAMREDLYCKHLHQLTSTVRSSIAARRRELTDQLATTEGGQQQPADQAAPWPPTWRGLCATITTQAGGGSAAVPPPVEPVVDLWGSFELSYVEHAREIIERRIAAIPLDFGMPEDDVREKGGLLPDEEAEDEDDLDIPPTRGPSSWRPIGEAILRRSTSRLGERRSSTIGIGQQEHPPTDQRGWIADFDAQIGDIIADAATVTEGGVAQEEGLTEASLAVVLHALWRLLDRELRRRLWKEEVDQGEKERGVEVLLDRWRHSRTRLVVLAGNLDDLLQASQAAHAPPQPSRGVRMGISARSSPSATHLAHLLSQADFYPSLLPYRAGLLTLLSRAVHCAYAAWTQLILNAQTEFVRHSFRALLTAESPSLDSPPLGAGASWAAVAMEGEGGGEGKGEVGVPVQVCAYIFDLCLLICKRLLKVCLNTRRGDVSLELLYGVKTALACFCMDLYTTALPPALVHKWRRGEREPATTQQSVAPGASQELTLPSFGHALQVLFDLSFLKMALSCKLPAWLLGNKTDLTRPPPPPPAREAVTAASPQVGDGPSPSLSSLATVREEGSIGWVMSLNHLLSLMEGHYFEDLVDRMTYQTTIRSCAQQFAGGTASLLSPLFLYNPAHQYIASNPPVAHTRQHPTPAPPTQQQSTDSLQPSGAVQVPSQNAPTLNPVAPRFPLLPVASTPLYGGPASRFATSPPPPFRSPFGGRDGAAAASASAVNGMQPTVPSGPLTSFLRDQVSSRVTSALTVTGQSVTEWKDRVAINMPAIPEGGKMWSKFAHWKASADDRGAERQAGRKE